MEKGWLRLVVWCPLVVVVEQGMAEAAPGGTGDGAFGAIGAAGAAALAGGRWGAGESALSSPGPPAP
jgi:hypothetical protein